MYFQKFKDIDSKFSFEEIEFPKPINPVSFNILSLLVDNYEL